MYSFEDLLEKNLPVCVQAKKISEINTSWPKQIALFILVTTACLSGITALTYFTYQWGIHSLLPLGINFDPMLMIFDVVLFILSIGCLALWLQEENQIDLKNSPKKSEDLDYIFPQSHSLHIKEQAWDLTNANSIVLDYPQRVLVHFKNPDQTFVLTDDRSGFPVGMKDSKKLKELARNNALFVYLTGVDLPNRYIYSVNWLWNIGAGAMFIFTTMLPFLFQAMGLELYWIGFLAIPVSYLAFSVGQKEFQRHKVFTYAQFLADNHNQIDTHLYRPPLI